MTTLSTHVLDTASGRPAAGMRVTLLHDDRVLFSGVTDSDGRCAELKAIGVTAGAYVLRFAVAAYFRAHGHVLPEPPFLDEVQVDFGMTGAGHYHVPLLVSPFGYSTYRGS
ncbi:hydroxyisourate hydrolase [Asaia spathodeae]|uniref:hydroxyisourate hydrolase n=1 Tax=Asaia spathodeae TaxID=657016 RepID=UPI002FC2ECA2